MVELLTLASSLYYIAKDTHLIDKINELSNKGKENINEFLNESQFDENGNPILPPNWAKTKELWEKNPEAKAKKQLVYCTNDHTNGIRYKIIWSKRRVLVENKTLYSLSR